MVGRSAKVRYAGFGVRFRVRRYRVDGSQRRRVASDPLLCLHALWAWGQISVGELAVLVESGLESGEVIGPWNLADSELREVGRRELDVEDAEFALPEAFDEGDEGDFGGVGGLVEHGLAEKRSAQGHAVETADEFSGLPAFDGVGQAQLMQAGIGDLNLFGDPGAFVAVGASVYDLWEGGIEADVESPTAVLAGEVFRHMEGFEFDDSSRIRAEPLDFALDVHREDTVGVRGHEYFRSERHGEHGGYLTGNKAAASRG